MWWMSDRLRCWEPSPAQSPLFLCSRRRGTARSGRGSSQASLKSPWPEQGCRRTGHICWGRDQADTAQPRPDTSTTGKCQPCLEKVWKHNVAKCRLVSSSLSQVLQRALKILPEAISGFQDPKGHFLPEFHVLLWAEAEPGHLTKSLPTLTMPLFYFFCKGKG